MKLPNSLSSSSSRSRSRAHWGQAPAAIFVGPKGWPANFLFLHLFPNRTQLLENKFRELEARTSGKTSGAGSGSSDSRNFCSLSGALVRGHSGPQG